MAEYQTIPPGVSTQRNIRFSLSYHFIIINPRLRDIMQLATYIHVYQVSVIHSGYHSLLLKHYGGTLAG